ncbi:hypothetical protein JCM10207_004629 [Rhodosporidiobolus poonsookiae]
MVKRILDDSYKPLRVKGYQKPVPQPAPLPSQLFTPASADKPAADPSADAHNPWTIAFKAPDHYNPAPGYRARIPLGAGPSVKAKEVAAARRAGSARKARLSSAYEKSLDYRGGVRGEEAGGGGGAERHDTAMLGLGGWGGIVENRILQAQREGLFKINKGRGKPLPKDDAESNPFISRSEFLINRILVEQEVSPPWVELQKELEGALASFRSELRANWTRRALRIRSSEGLTSAVVREILDGWKDPEWEQREKAYHECSLSDLNNLTRKYNVIAPYHVRRPLLTLRSELDQAIASCAPAIAQELKRRLDVGMASPSSGKVVYHEPEDDVRSVTADEMGGEKKAVKESMWTAFRRLVVEVLAQPPDPQPVAARQGRRE